MFSTETNAFIQQCMDSSFQGDPLLADNTLLKAEKDYNMTLDNSIVPCIFVNSKFVRGAIIPEDIFDEICESFTNPPS